MSVLRLTLAIMVFAIVITSCSSSKNIDLKKGDILVTLVGLNERAETKWEDPSFRDGFISLIPKNTKLEVLYTPDAGAAVFECRPIEVNELKEAEAVEEFFVPESFRKKDDYVTYSFTLKKELLGAKLKKLEK